MIKHRKTFFAGYLNIDVLHYESNKKVQHFLSSMFQYNIIPAINKPTCVTRNVMKVIGKSKIKSTKFPHKLSINKVDDYNKPEIADAFSDFFTNIGQNLPSQIPKSSKTFETCISKVNVIMDSKPLSINELRGIFLAKNK